MASMNELMRMVTHSFEFIEGGLPELKPRSFVLKEQLSAPYHLTLDLTTRAPSIDEAKLLGQACTLTLDRGGMLRRFNGVVTSANIDEVALNALTPQGQLPTAVVQLIVEPAVALLGQRRDMRIFQNETVPDIIKKVLSQGLQDYWRKVTLKASKRYEPLEYCTQYNETDLDFVLRLMGEAGLMWYFKQGEKEEELVVFDDADNYQPLETSDHQPVPFETSMGDQQWVETVSAFKARAALRSTAVHTRHFNWSVGSRPEGEEATGEDALHRTRELFHGDGPVRLGGLQSSGLYLKSTAQAQATLAKDFEVSRQSLYEGDGGVTGFSPGVVFELTNSLREELNRKYLVTEVEHTGRAPAEKPGSFAGNEAEVLYSNSFSCVGKDVLYRLPVPARRYVQTMQTAVVVGDEDVTTDVHGRIKVQFHWDRQGKNDRNSSCWVRVAQASAGVGFGCVFIPRKGQEVVVSFLEGDPDKPLVIGSVYNGINGPPYPLPDEKTRSVIRTRSTPDGSGYNELSFEDAKGAEEVYLQAEKDMRQLVKHDHTVYVANNEVLRVGDDSEGGKTTDGNRTRWVKNDETIDVGGNRVRTVKKDETVSIDGKRTETVKLDETITIGGNRTHTVEKSESTEVKANRTERVGKDESIAIAGNRSETVDKDEQITISGNRTESVAKDESVSIQGGQTVNVTKDQSLTVSGGRTTSVSKDDALQVGKTLAVDAADRIALQSGSARIVLKKDGTIIIEGKDITVRGSGKINLNADGDVIVNGRNIKQN